MNELPQFNIEVIPVDQFCKDPARYLKGIAKKPIAIRASDGRVFMAIGGLVDLEED